MGTLYIVATPIGNLEDMTYRAVRILQEVQLIAAEDTRTSRVLIQHFNIDTPMTSYHEHNKLTKLQAVFDTLKSGDVALISDAGTPGISDPGYELIHEAIQRGYAVVPIPGANAVITALVASGLPTDSFIYLGFLPKKQSARREVFQRLKNERRTMIAYESPHRVADTLGQVAAVLGDDRQVCIAREMTKKFEEFWRGTAKQAAQHFNEENPKGEITLLIEGAADATNWDKSTVLAALENKLEEGLSLSQAAKEVAALSGWKKSVIYELGLAE
ncbi:MAG: 16S rRNA (cytidine(1402)-2'-O)-methyltransferase [Phototrophicaceae bacterium]